jgi:hypothetical protein
LIGGSVLFKKFWVLQLKWRSSSGKMMQKEVAIVKSLIMLGVYFWLNTKNYGKYRNMANLKYFFLISGD